MCQPIPLLLGLATAFGGLCAWAGWELRDREARRDVAGLRAALDDAREIVRALHDADAAGERDQVADARE